MIVGSTSDEFGGAALVIPEGNLLCNGLRFIRDLVSAKSTLRANSNMTLFCAR